MHVVHKYAYDVHSGNKKGCLWVRLACERHLKDRKRDDIYFDEEAAERAIQFIEKFRHYKGQWAGKRFRLEPWQKFIVGCIFGWKRTVNDLRKYRHAYVEIPRKNGKTILGAGIALYMLCADGEGGAEVYSVATKQDQSKILWRDARTMLEKCKSPSFIERFEIRKNPAIIEYPGKDSLLSPLSREASNLDGLNPHCIVADELHAWKDPDLWNVLNSALGARSQPLFLQITTAGYVSNGVCREQQRHVQSILNETQEHDSYFGIIYTLDEGDDEESEESWAKANPNYGVSVLKEGMRSDFNLAKANPTLMADFKVKRLNVWVTAAQAWLNILDWKECYEEILPEELKGLRCYGGLDLAQVRDLSAFVLLFPPQDGLERWTVLVWFWCPQDNIFERSKQDHVPYYAWSDKGYIEATPGNVTDYDFIQAKIVELAGVYDIRFVAFDRTFSGQIVNRLLDEGLEMIQYGQGYVSMSCPAKELERMILGHEVNHFANPVLQWNAENTIVSRDPAGNIKPDKSKSEEKIDGIVALIMALGLAMEEEEKLGGFENGLDVW